MLKQSLQQKLLGKLSPQQIQLIKLLQVPTMELEARIKEELEANPALEEGGEVDPDAQGDLDDAPEEASDAMEEFNFDEYLDDETPDYKLSARNQGADDDEQAIPFASGSTFQELLVAQLGMLDITSEERNWAELLIGYLDESGYLRRDLESIVNDLAFTQGVEVEQDALRKALENVQSLDPAGVGARHLQECLLLQLRRKFEEDSGQSLTRSLAQRVAIEILEHQFERFTKKHYDRIRKSLDLDEDTLRDALSEITRLNPKPGNAGRDSSRTAGVQHVVPDFLLAVEDDEVRLQLNTRNAPELRVSPQYKEMMQTYASGAKQDAAQREALAFVKQKVDSAKWFVEAIQQRHRTLELTMRSIVAYQQAYFLSGDEADLRPMILKDIADRIGMDISTVSRVANSKYVQTPYGTFLLKSFFSEALTTETGEEVSSREVKKILADAIEAEDKSKPLPDEKLGKLLNEKGYNIARRTVAKYREQLGIPVARLRKEI